MKEIVAVIFGLGLLGNALLFVPQVLAVLRKKSDDGAIGRLPGDIGDGGEPAQLWDGHGIDTALPRQASSCIRRIGIVAP